MLVFQCVKNTDKISEVHGVSLRWADQLTIAREGDELRVRGDCMLEGRIDIMQAYERDEISPHLRFANCIDDEALIAFVRQFGPVVASSATWDILPVESDDIYSKRYRGILKNVTTSCPGFSRREIMGIAARRMRDFEPPLKVRGATQLLSELRGEQSLFKAAVEITRTLIAPQRLASRNSSARASNRSAQAVQNVREMETARLVELVSFVEEIRKVVEGAVTWERQLQREMRALFSVQTRVLPEWNWSQSSHEELRSHLDRANYSLEEQMAGRNEHLFLPDPFEEAKGVIAILLNAFPPTLTWVGDHLRDSPSSSLHFGIRPLLYAMLRRDVSRGREIRTCARPGCGQLFVATRQDKHCHSTECSKKMASNKHYETKVRPARQKKAASRFKRKSKSQSQGA
jgi:hypothetical protein